MKKYSEGAKFKRWWDQDEAAQELSEKTGTKLTPADILRCALDERGVRFVLDVPAGTKDRQSRPMEPGLWELMTEGAFGEPGRRQVEFDINPDVSVEGFDGAWVERAGVRRQLPPPGYLRWPEGCTLGLRRQDVEDLAETLNKEKPTPSAPKSADALDKPLGERERETLLVIIAALAKKAEIDMSHPTTAAKKIVREVELLGAKIHWQTVDNKLKQVKEVVEKLKT